MEILAIIFFWLGNLADWYTTKRLVLDRKVGKEVNPVIAALIDKLGTDELGWGMTKAEVGLLVVKILFGVMLHLLGVGALTFWLAGSLFAAAAISNKWNLLGKLIAKFKD
jgi:hypothetical protein